MPAPVAPSGLVRRSLLIGIAAATLGFVANASAQTHVAVEASACWVLTDTAGASELRAEIEPWSSELQMSTQFMPDEAMALTHRELGLLVTIHPFPDQGIIQVAAFARVASESTEAAFADLAHRLEQSSGLSQHLRHCAESGHTVGKAHFEQP